MRLAQHHTQPSASRLRRLRRLMLTLGG